MSKKFRIVLFTNDSSTKREIALSKFQTFLLGFVAFAIFSTVTAFSVKTVSDYLYSFNLDLLRQERMAISSELRQLNKDTAALNERMKDLFKSDSDLRMLINMEAIDADIKAVGTGGESNISKSGSDFFFTEQELLFESHSKLEKLLNQISLQEESYSDKLVGLSQNNEIIKYYPAIKPINGGYISSHFGYRDDPITGENAWHPALDISVNQGTPIHAAADGVIVKAERRPNTNGLGIYVKIDHNSEVYGYESWYGHMSEIDGKIRVGAKVKRGDVLGLTGRTGRVTAPHLHYMLKYFGKEVDPRVKNWRADTFSR